MNTAIHVLFIEDNLGDARLVEEQLRLASSKVMIQLEWVDHLEKGLARLQSNNIDVILLDLSLPDSEGLNTLERVLASVPSLPVIVMTGQADEAVALGAVQAGAQDYLIKGQVDGQLLIRSIQYAIRRKRTEEALRKSEERFRLIVESAPSAMITVDHKGNIELVNAEAEKLFGYNTSALTGQVVELLVAPLFRETHKQLRQQYMAQPRPIAVGLRGSLHGLHKDGHEIPLEIGLAPYQSSNGLHVLALINDITVRKKAEENLAASEAKLRSVFAAMHDIVLTIDSEGVYREVAPTNPGLLVQPPEELLGKSLRDVFPAEQAQEFLNIVKDVVERREARQLEYQLQIGERNYWFSTNITPIGSDATVWVAREITDRKLADIRIRQQIEQLKALREIDQAISTSFDLRLTLNTVLLQVITQLQTDAALILLLDSEEQNLVYAAGQGFRTRAVESVRVPLGQSQAGQASNQHRVINVENLNDQLATLLAGEDFASYFGIPLISKRNLIGVLEVCHRARFEPSIEWLDFLSTLAGQAAIAIENTRLFENLQESNRELFKAYDATIEGWSRALDLRDRETEGHTLRVTEMAISLAQKFGFSEEELLHIRWGALLHDIGKMGVPDHILLKPEPLTEQERITMQKHPQYAHDLIKPIDFLQSTLDIPLCHHEKWDGRGYPRGLKYEEIPMAARLFAVVDVWDALTSDRPYRPAWTKEQALDYIKEQSGKHFDPQTVEAFLSLIAHT